MTQESRGTVLVADDEDLLRRLVVRVLHTAGFRTLEARDPETAVRLFAECSEPVHVTLVDVGMFPGDTQEKLRQMLQRRTDVGVIFTSGAALEAPLDAQLHACNGFFLRKPFAPRDLVATVEALLPPQREKE